MRSLAALLFLSLCLTSGADDRPRWQVPFFPSSGSFPDDSAWSGVPAFTLSRPLNAPEGPAPEPTEVKVMWTEKIFYVRFVCRDVAIAGEAGDPAVEKTLHGGDCVEVFLDAVGDGRAFVEIQVSPDGRVFDAIHLYTQEPRHGEDLMVLEDVIKSDSWFFPEWKLDGLVARPFEGDQQWGVVVAIPARKLLQRLGRPGLEAGMVLRANFIRMNYSPDRKEPEITNWAPVIFGRVHRSPAGMGYLVLEGSPAKN